MNIIRDLFKDYRFVLSFSVLLILLALAVTASFCPYDPTLTGVVPRDMKPSAEYWLGTDSKGQDVFWQATFAIRNSLIVSVIAALISRIIAVLVGMVAGYVGGITDRLLMFVSDSLLVIPLFLVLVMMSMLVREYMNLFILALLLSVFGWAWDARVIRSLILSLREREFTKTAILSGTGTVRLVLNEYIPFTLPLIFSTIINNMAWAIGYGADPRHPGAGQYEHPHSRHDDELGDLLSGDPVTPLVVDPDTGHPIGLPVRRPVLALGQHQRISRSAHPHAAGWNVGEVQPWQTKDKPSYEPTSSKLSMSWRCTARRRLSKPLTTWT